MGLRVPAEWEPHERTMVAWPTRDGVWGPLRAEAEAAYLEVIEAVAQFEPCTVIAPPGAVAHHAAQRCDISTPFPIELVELAIDDSWVRDNGPLYAFDDHRRVITDWVFNSWGGKYVPYDDDAALTRRWAQLRGEPCIAVDAVLEGGSINVDGQGTLVTTIQCLMHPNRNPALTRVDLEALCAEYLGADAVLWLPYGLVDDDDTDGHVDNVAAFCQPGRLLVQGCDDVDEPDSLRLAVNRRTAERWRDARGVPLEAIEIPVLPFATVAGARRPVPYLNFYILNGAVLVPICGHEADDDILDMLDEQFPGREVVGLDVGAVLALGGGGIHCITQQIPLA